MDKCRVATDEIILVRSGVNTGDCAVVPAVLNGAFAAYDLIFRARSVTLPYFITSFLDTEIGRLQLNLVRGRAAQPHVNVEEVSAIRLPVPSINVQRTLVAELQAAREVRNEKLRRAYALLATLDAYLVDALNLKPLVRDTRNAFGARLRNVRRTERLNADYFHPERIRAIKTLHTTTSARLADIVDFRRDQCLASANENYIGLAHVQSHTGELVAAEEEATGQCFAFEREDVLFARLRPYLNKVHRAERAGVCSTEFHVMRIRDQSQILPDYLATMLRCSLIVAQTRHMMTGNTHPRLANDDVVNLVIPILSGEVQQQIAAELRRRRDEARRLRSEAEADWTAAKRRFEACLLSR
jgi:type I restriction enzyme S subunit